MSEEGRIDRLRSSKPATKGAVMKMLPFGLTKLVCGDAPTLETPLDVAALSEVEFVMTGQDFQKRVERRCAVSEGVVNVALEKEDTDTPGLYYARWIIDGSRTLPVGDPKPLQVLPAL